MEAQVGQLHVKFHLKFHVKFHLKIQVKFHMKNGSPGRPTSCEISSEISLEISSEISLEISHESGPPELSYGTKIGLSQSKDAATMYTNTRSCPPGFHKNGIFV